LIDADKKKVTSLTHNTNWPYYSWAALTSPFFTVIDWRRGVISSLMLDKKFWEIRRASCRRGRSGWLDGVCFSRS